VLVVTAACALLAMPIQNTTATRIITDVLTFMLMSISLFCFLLLNAY
jgi:hypothetical protein